MYDIFSVPYIVAFIDTNCASGTATALLQALSLVRATRPYGALPRGPITT